MVKNYTIEELKNLDKDELIAVARMIVDGQDDFTLEKWKIIRDKLGDAISKNRLKKERQEDIEELLVILKHHEFGINPRQVEELTKAYDAYDREDWASCRSALKVFFKWTGNRGSCQ